MLITANGIAEHALMKFPNSLLIYSMWNGYKEKILILNDGDIYDVATGETWAGTLT